MVLIISSLISEIAFNVKIIWQFLLLSLLKILKLTYIEFNYVININILGERAKELPKSN